MKLSDNDNGKRFWLVADAITINDDDPNHPRGVVPELAIFCWGSHSHRPCAAAGAPHDATAKRLRIDNSGSNICTATSGRMKRAATNELPWQTLEEGERVAPATITHSRGISMDNESCTANQRRRRMRHNQRRRSHWHKRCQCDHERHDQHRSSHWHKLH